MLRTLVVVLAGGAGGRLELLTRDRAKPAVPYGGSYRLIDFPLSNCLNSGLSDVWVLEQHNPVSLADHLSGGRPWDLDRTTGGLLVLHPRLGEGREGWHQGTADALWRQAQVLRELAPQVVVVVSADAVYRLDYHDLAAGHHGSGAAATMVTTRVPAAEAGRYGVVRAEGGEVRDYRYKPADPDGNLVANEVFAFAPDRLLDALEAAAGDVGDEGLEDLGTEVLPRLVAAGSVREQRLDGYWRDLGTVDAYWSSHMDLLADPSPLDLDDPAWPVRTRSGATAPARVLAGAAVRESLVAGGARVAGSVTRSVLSPGVVVEAGASVRDSVLLPGAVVRAGAEVVCSVLDDRVEVGRDARVGGSGEVSLLGLRTRVREGAELPPGARQPDDEDG